MGFLLSSNRLYPILQFTNTIGGQKPRGSGFRVQGSRVKGSAFQIFGKAYDFLKCNKKPEFRKIFVFTNPEP